MSASPTLPPRPPRVDPDLLRGLASAYATLLARQRAASTAFARSSAPTRRGHGFAWLPAGSGSLLRNDLPVRAGLDSPFGQELAAMRAAVELNPYERELIYGYAGGIDILVFRMLIPGIDFEESVRIAQAGRITDRIDSQEARHDHRKF